MKFDSKPGFLLRADPALALKLKQSRANKVQKLLDSYPAGSELLSLLKVDPTKLNEFDLLNFLDRVEEVQYEAFNSGFEQGFEQAEAQT